MSNRFDFALRHTTAAHWQLFEVLASKFLAEEYGQLRTLATPSGDEGRDATIFQPIDDPEVAVQYSVQTDWKEKIRKTAHRLADRHSQVSLLVYVTPLSIGAKVDTVRASMRKDFHLYLDIRDASYFIEREQHSQATATAADQYCRAVVDPILQEAGVIDRRSSQLTSHETRAALLYLVLQHEDATADRQLTKLCFDALVRAVLRDSDNEHRLTRADIHQAVAELLPTHDRTEVTEYVDRALMRMNKQVVRHWIQEDVFCLTFNERTRLSEGLARLAILNEEFESELLNNLQFVADALPVDLGVVDRHDLVLRLRRIMERFLFERGEAFVETLRTGDEMLFVTEEITEVVIADVLAHPDTSSVRHNLVPLMSETVQRTLRLPTERVQHYLRAVSDGYTLLAFLRETPNVQSAVSKLFSYAQIWLDTTAVLPLLAEELLEPEQRRYSRVFREALEAGVKFYVTPGVIDEIESHITICVQAWRSLLSWNGRTPFLLASFIWSGREQSGFPKWVENFRGQVRPHDDLVEYLEAVLVIRVSDLSPYAEMAPEELRWHTEAYWQEVHERRRPSDSSVAAVVRQLASHDVENFLGVLQKRGGEQVGNPFGYTTWWLTLDRHASRAAGAIAERAGIPNFDSPVLTIDFLTYYLIVGPARRQLSRSSERQLPLIVDQSLLEVLPRALMKAAEAARRDVEGQDDRLIRRKIRDHLDQQKLRAGSVGSAGLEAIREDIQMVLETASGKRSYR